MDATSVVAIVVAGIGSTGSILAAYVARQTRNGTRPISNGFAADMVRRLERIEDLKGDNARRLTRIEGLMLDHLEDHASARQTRTTPRRKQ